MSGPGMVLERHGRVTPLGIRFWDEAINAAVAEGLEVTVYPLQDAARRAAARPNAIKTFVLPQLPGPRFPEQEFGPGDEEFRPGDERSVPGDDKFWSRVKPRAFGVEVKDRRGYYQPFTLDLKLPFRGLAVPAFVPPTSPPSEVVTLFPTASRPVPAGIAVVRSELQTPVPGRESELQPASWAVLEVQVGTTPPVRGLADREGRIAILLPYPEPTPARARPASPPYPAATPLHTQTWPVRLTAFYEAAAPAPLIPDLRRTLEQAPAMLWTQDAGGRRPLGDQVLRYGEELIVRSVVVTPAGSPP